VAARWLPSRAAEGELAPSAGGGGCGAATGTQDQAETVGPWDSPAASGPVPRCGHPQRHVAILGQREREPD
jgi:hypothetical protein